MRLNALSQIALLAGALYVGSLILLHLGMYSFGITPTVIWLGMPIEVWLGFVQISVVVIAVALATHHMLERPLNRLNEALAKAKAARGEDVLVGIGTDDAAEGSALLLESTIADKNRQIADANRNLSDLVRELSLLYEIGQGINSTIEIEELLDVITKMMEKHLKLDEFAILLMEENRDALRVRAAYGFPNVDRINDMVFQVGEGICGEVARTGKLVYVRDTVHDKRYLHYRGEYKASGAFLSIPLRYKKEVLGVINFSRRGVASFTKNDLRLLTLVANQIALAISNARLFTRTRELSVRDELTGLYNRRHFQQVLQVEWKRAVRFKRALSLLMIDVDRFKLFNDSFGHVQGDKVLRQISQILQRNLREVDTVARFGGEEFVALLPDTDRSGALAVGEKLRRLVEQEKFPLPSGIGGETTPLTISTGVAVYPDDVGEMDDLIDHADIALYDAKDSGRNRVICYPQLPEAIEKSAE